MSDDKTTSPRYPRGTTWIETGIGPWVPAVSTEFDRVQLGVMTTEGTLPSTLFGGFVNPTVIAGLEALLENPHGSGRGVWATLDEKSTRSLIEMLQAAQWDRGWA